VDALIDTIPIEPYDLEVARTHADLPQVEVRVLGADRQP
jgi:hypothetical protein